MTEHALDTKEACILFDAGALASATAVKAPMQEGCWLLQLTARKGGMVYTLAAQREAQRIFKSADAVIATANKIGFRQIKFQI